jgi:hypothetical protein
MRGRNMRFALKVKRALEADQRRLQTAGIL